MRGKDKEVFNLPPNVFIPPQNNVGNISNNNNNVNGHGMGSLFGDTPSPLTVGGYASSGGDIDDESAASLRPLTMVDGHRRRSGSGGPRFFKPRGSPRPMGGGQRKFATPPERTPSARGGINGSRPEQMRQEGRLKRQNSDPSPTMKRKPKLEVYPPPSPSPNHNSSSDLFMLPLNNIMDDDLLKVPLRCGASPSVGSFQSDPESCLDGLQFQYNANYGEEDDDYDEPFSIDVNLHKK